MHYFSIFSKKFNKPCVYFLARLDQKQKLLRNFPKIFKQFLQELAKIHYFSIFFKKFNKPMRSLFAVWTKKNKLLRNFQKILKALDENSIENLNFIIIFRKFVTKNRAFWSNTIFLNRFFGLRGGGITPSPPPKSASGFISHFFHTFCLTAVQRGWFDPPKFSWCWHSFSMLHCIVLHCTRCRHTVGLD